MEVDYDSDILDDDEENDAEQQEGTHRKKAASKGDLRDPEYRRVIDEDQVGIGFMSEKKKQSLRGNCLLG